MAKAHGRGPWAFDFSRRRCVLRLLLFLMPVFVHQAFDGVVAAIIAAAVVGIMVMLVLLKVIVASAAVEIVLAASAVQVIVAGTSSEQITPAASEQQKALAFLENDPARLKSFTWLLFNLDEFVYVR